MLVAMEKWFKGIKSYVTWILVFLLYLKNYSRYQKMFYTKLLQ